MDLKRERDKQNEVIRHKHEQARMNECREEKKQRHYTQNNTRSSLFMCFCVLPEYLTPDGNVVDCVGVVPVA